MSSARRQKMRHCVFQTRQEVEDFLGDINPEYAQYGLRLWNMGVENSEEMAVLRKDHFRSAGILPFHAIHLVARCQELSVPPRPCWPENKVQRCLDRHSQLALPQDDQSSCLAKAKLLSLSKCRSAFVQFALGCRGTPEQSCCSGLFYFLAALQSSQQDAWCLKRLPRSMFPSVSMSRRVAVFLHQS